MVRRRSGSRWSLPSTLLQAARFQRRVTGQEVVEAVRTICPGHSSSPCRLDTSKLSEYETGVRRPSVRHMEAFCRYYQRGPEELGFITWRDDPPGSEKPEAPAIAGSAGTPPDDPYDTRCACGDGSHPPRLVLVWIRERLDPEGAALASAVLHALSQDPS